MNFIKKCLFALKRLEKPKAIIPAISLNEILQGQQTITLTELKVAEGNVSITELMVLATLVKKHGPQRIFEIGTFDGRTTLNLANNSSVDARVFTLDLLKKDMENTKLPLLRGEEKFIDKDASGQRYLGKGASKITQLFGDSATFDFTPFVDSIDFMFVDGAHSYNYVLNDSKIALKIVRQGGVIAWHDYDTLYSKELMNALHKLYLEDEMFNGLRHIEGTSLVVLWKDGQT